MRVIKVGARVGGGELVGEALPRRNRILSDPRDTVHVIAQRDSVPVNARAGVEFVVHLDTQEVSGLCPQKWSWQRIAVAPGLNHEATKIQRDGLGNEARVDDPLIRCATTFLCPPNRRGRDSDGRAGPGPRPSRHPAETE